MKNSYYLLVDLTKDNNDINKHRFLKIADTNDLTSYILNFARHNKTEIQQVRFYKLESKKQAETMQREYTKHYNFKEV